MLVNHILASSYLVGGAVRDALLGIADGTLNDRDWVVVGVSSEQMLAAGFKQVGKDFPVFLHPDTHEEYALARTERKQGVGHTGFTVHATPDVSLEDDLLRRDLTINALAQNAQGELIDPFGGQADLNNATLRHVSAAFAEDPLRVLRVARFSAKLAKPLVHTSFTVHPSTLVLMQSMSDSDELDTLSGERLWQELHKALSCTNPLCFFDVLKNTRALHHVFNGNASQYDAGKQALSYACAISNDVEIRFAAIMSVLTCEQQTNLFGRFKCPKRFSQLAQLTQQCAKAFYDILDASPPQIMAFLKRADAFRKPERFAQLLLACDARARSMPNESNKPMPQREFLMDIFNATTPISQKDIMRLNLKGAEIAEEIETQRCAAIVKIKRSYRWSYQDKHLAKIKQWQTATGAPF